MIQYSGTILPVMHMDIIGTGLIKTINNPSVFIAINILLHLIFDINHYYFEVYLPCLTYIYFKCQKGYIFA